MAQVILAGKDWQARALLRAQLIEEGVEVEAYPTVAEALEGMGDLLPALLVADLTESEDPTSEIKVLSKWTRQIPVWIIAGRNLTAGRALRGRGFEMILYRPIDVGELVERIKRRIVET
jgi:DNA-binding response OmpR family regulator